MYHAAAKAKPLTATVHLPHGNALGGHLQLFILQDVTQSLTGTQEMVIHRSSNKSGTDFIDKTGDEVELPVGRPDKK